MKVAVAVLTMTMSDDNFLSFSMASHPNEVDYLLCKCMVEWVQRQLVERLWPFAVVVAMPMAIVLVAAVHVVPSSSLVVVRAVPSYAAVL